MRLIETWELKLVEFFGDRIPEYAILSHRWEDGEVSFQDWQDPSLARNKKGFFKIAMACEQAQKHGLKYLWVDTNCIDKTSSAELSEAINSMFAWYQQASKCYAYLSDVEPMPEEWGSMTVDYEMHFCRSKWFTRGWTLQELLAPADMTFYSRDWSKIASRSTLAGIISNTTQIGTMYLRGDGQHKDASIAQKMSWVSRRVTTRIEDMAYCMLGIFDINMPLLYGEGSKSFTRLQEEIIRVSNDQTIFCWTWINLVPPRWVSLLAPCPEAFKHSGDFISADSGLVNKATFKMTNAGLSITLAVIQTWSYYLGILNASIRHPADGAVGVACVPIQGHLDAGKMSRNTMRRLQFPPGPVLVPTRWMLCRSHMYIRSNPGPTDGPSLIPSGAPFQRHQYSFLLVFDDTQKLIRDPENMKSDSFDGICLLERTRDEIDISIFPRGVFDRKKSLVTVDLTSLPSGLLIRLGTKTSPQRVLFLGINSGRNGLNRFCGIVPESILMANRNAHELLKRLLELTREESKKCDIGWGYGLGIIMREETVTGAGLVCLTFITCGYKSALDQRPETQHWELDNDTDTRSDVAAAGVLKTYPERFFGIFEKEDY